MAKAKRSGEVPTIALQPKVTIHEHAPGKTIGQAVAHANAHVANVNKAAK
jgi:hypothetical protein